MSKTFTSNEYKKVYETLILHTEKYIKKNKYDNAVKCIRAAAQWAYHFNWIYSDKRLDDYTLIIGRKWLKPFNINKNVLKRYLLLDTHGIDNRCLTQQYMRGLMAMNAEFLYISMEPNAKLQRDIRIELSSYNKATTLFLDGKMSQHERLLKAAKIVEEYQPQIALAHIFPWDLISLMLLDAAKGMQVYNINFTDHAFWMGSSIIDYNIEFRDYGMSVSLDKRGLKKEQLLSLPFYPIKPINEPFQGFPELPSDSIKIFSGGSFYKMFGENDMYFKMCDKILDLSANVVLLIAGSGNNNIMRSKIQSMRNASKVYLIGDRRDINEVFKHCDIYLNTYPLPGGLMSQYAAYNSKPIVTFGKKNVEFSRVEGLVNHFDNNVKTFLNLEDLLEYISKCINDKDFSNVEGEKNKKGLMTEQKFNEILCHILNGNYSDDFNWKKLDINYNDVASLYLDVENNYSKSAPLSLLVPLRFKSFYLFPKYTPIFIPFFINKLKKLITRGA